MFCPGTKRLLARNATLSSGFLSAAPESFDTSKLNRRHSGRGVLANLPTWSPASRRGLHLPAGAASINKNAGARKSSKLNGRRSEKFLERTPRILSSSLRLSSSLCCYTSAKMWLEEHHQEWRSKHHRRRERRSAGGLIARTAFRTPRPSWRRWKDLILFTFATPISSKNV